MKWILKSKSCFIKIKAISPDDVYNVFKRFQQHLLLANFHRPKGRGFPWSNDLSHGQLRGADNPSHKGMVLRLDVIVIEI